MPDQRLPSSYELEHYAGVLRRHWRLLLAGLAVPLALAMLYLRLTPPVYEATALVMAVNPTTGEMAKEPASTAPARALFTSRPTAAKVIAELGLDRGDQALTANAFVTERLRVDEVRGTSMLRVSVRMPDPALAARLANRLTKLIAERSTQVGEAEESAERTLLKAQLDEADASLRAVEERLLASKTDAQLERLRQESQTLLDERAEAARLLLDIEAERARLTVAEQELQKLGSMPAAADARPQPGSAASPSTNPPGGRTQTARGTAAVIDDAEESGITFAGRSLREALELHAAISRTRLAGFEAQRRQLLRRADPDGPLHQRLSRLYEHELAIARLELEQEVLEAVYSDLARRYQQARIDGIAQATALEVIEPAVPPATPAFPRPSRILGLALLGGLFLSLVAAFLLDAVPGRRLAAGSRGAAHPNDV